MDWDNDNDGDGQRYDCDGPPVGGLGLASADWYGDVCPNDVQTGSGNEYDWERFWWDMVETEGLTVADVMNLWDDADPDDWTASGSFYLPDYPALRFLTSATTNGLLTEYNNQDNTNGVHR